MCKSIIALLQDSIAGSGISQQQIDSARGVAEVNPETDAARELLEFLDNKEVQNAIVRDAAE